jgi:hypothetical protein
VLRENWKYKDFMKWVDTGGTIGRIIGSLFGPPGAALGDTIGQIAGGAAYTGYIIWKHW